MKAYDYLMTYSNGGLKYEELLSELFIILNKIYLLVKNCGKKKWSKAAIIQLKNKESFKELILKCCYEARSDMLLKDLVKYLKAKYLVILML